MHQITSTNVPFCFPSQKLSMETQGRGDRRRRMIEGGTDRRKSRTRFSLPTFETKERKRRKGEAERERGKRVEWIGENGPRRNMNNSSGVVPGDDLQRAAATKQSKCIKDTNLPGRRWLALIRSAVSPRDEMIAIYKRGTGSSAVQLPCQDPCLPRRRVFETRTKPRFSVSIVSTPLFIVPFPAKFPIFSLSLFFSF